MVVNGAALDSSYSLTPASTADSMATSATSAHTGRPVTINRETNETSGTEPGTLPPMATYCQKICESPGILPSVCRVHSRIQFIELRMALCLFDMPFAAVLNIGAEISLTGDEAFDLCHTKKVKLFLE